MNKVLLILGCILVFIGISCGLLRKSSAKEKENAQASIQQAPLQKVEQKPLKSGDEEAPKLPEQAPNPSQPEPQSPRPKPDKPEPDRPKPLTQYDSQALDELVKNAAKKAQENPSTYRMLVRSDEDGARVYRMLGMHVIISPMGEETFLPDEI